MKATFNFKSRKPKKHLVFSLLLPLITSGCGALKMKAVEKPNKIETKKTINLDYSTARDILKKQLPILVDQRGKTAYPEAFRHPGDEDLFFRINLSRYIAGDLSRQVDEMISECDSATHPFKNIDIYLTPAENQSKIEINMEFVVFGDKIYSGGGYTAMPNGLGGFSINQDPTKYVGRTIESGRCHSTGLLEKIIFDLFPENLSTRPAVDYNLAARFSYLADEKGHNNALTLDTRTGLIWRRCSEGQTWNGNTCIGTELKLTYQQAIDHAKTQSGWHLPSIKELSSLVDLTVKERPTINAIAFPGAPEDRFWTVSPSSKYPSYAYSVSFISGNTYYFETDDLQAIRLVK